MARTLSALGLLLCSLVASATDTYESAAVESDGRLRIISSQGGEYFPAMDVGQDPSDRFERQVGFDQVQISPDKNTVGWLSIYPNCCTSYPIPLELVLFRSGHVVARFRGEGMPIWKWGFYSGGAEVVFSQRPTHGSSPDHYERREVGSGRLVADFDHEEDSAEPLPEWTQVLQ